MAAHMTAIGSSTLVNCTPHPIHVYNVSDDGSTKEIIETYPPSGIVPRLKQTAQEQIDTIPASLEGRVVPIYSAPQLGAVEGLPEFAEGEHKPIIVSLLVAQQLRDTKSWPCAVYAPDTGPAGVVRDDKGQIIGTKWLIEYYNPLRA